MTGVHLTITDILMKITFAIPGSSRHQYCWTPEGIIWFDAITWGWPWHEEGLIVPVIWDIGRKSSRLPKQELLIEKERGKLTPG
jgi:hypothetical protein